jgi:hypothetical protein
MELVSRWVKVKTGNTAFLVSEESLNHAKTPALFRMQILVTTDPFVSATLLMILHVAG